MLRNRVRIKEETNASQTLVQEIRRERCNPVEYREPCPRLQNEECDDLLQEEPDNDGWPGNV